MLNLQHNLVNMLYAIKCMIETHFSIIEEKGFKNKDKDIEHSRCVLKKIYEYADHAYEITKRIKLSMHAHDSANRMDSNTCIRDAWGVATKLLFEKSTCERVEVLSYLPEVFPELQVCKDELIEILHSIAQNAVQAMGGSGKLIARSSLQYTADNPEAVITISDTGPGIEPEILDKLFEPFFTTKSLKEGNGLGLCLAKALVKKNGGAMTASSFKGYGATFTITFPIRKMKPSEQDNVLADAKR